eukprot:GFUD01007522.1.p1 GENE.GFUD01007522.1~~GFUD01007522.1.p1  ORF type:complete len:459 (+),score=143.29 GFUD01007522.1:95-1378(+)
MAAKVILTAKQSSFKFSDRVLCLDCPVTIGRTGGHVRSASDNGYFDCKVLSKSHALLLYKDSKLYIIDTGSSNGTFVNNIRLSKAGKESDPTEVFTGDIIKLGSEVTDKNKELTQMPVVAKITLVMEDGLENRARPRSSLLFRPAESQEDVTIVADADQCSLSRESMMLLKEKLLEMEKGMEFLTFKEKDYEELQQLAEEEAETICELEKENYKLKHALANIENKIAYEKEKYLKLAEYEAETICNLEKENYKLTDSLNTAENNLQEEKQKYKILQKERELFDTKLHEAISEVNKKNNALEEAQSLLAETRNNVINLEKENANLRAQDHLQLVDAAESDYDLLIKAELNNLTESRRHSQANTDNIDEDDDEVFVNTLTALELDMNKQGNLGLEAGRPENQTSRPDIILLVIVAWISFMVGFCFDDIQ